MKKTIYIGTDMLFKLGVEPLLRQGKITPEQYAQCLSRAAQLPIEIRSSSIVIDL